MLQTNQAPGFGLIIQESGEGVTLTLAGFKDVALCLSVQEARTFASDLIQHAHRIEVKRSLKKAVVRASQPPRGANRYGDTSPSASGIADIWPRLYIG